MTFRSRLSRVVAAGVLSLSCTTTTEVEPPESRLELNDLTVPSTVVSAQPLLVQIRYGIGQCSEVTAVSGTLSSASRLEIEVRGRYLSGNDPCLERILYFRDTSLTVIAPQPGVLTVIGLQPHTEPIERAVTVTESGH